jgi:hypothetical protein
MFRQQKIVAVFSLLAFLVLACSGCGDSDSGGGAGQPSKSFTPDEIQKILASDAANGEGFGVSVGLSGDFIVVGTPLGNGVGATSTGAAYIFERDAAGTWTEAAKLTASGSQDGDEFGTSVAVSGDIALVGAVFANSPASSASGAAYVFERDAGGAWNEVVKLNALDAATGVDFGISAAVSGDIALVGAPFEDEIAPNAGAAYVFKRDAGGAWSEEKKLVGGDSLANDFFGTSVAVSGNFAVVGAPEEDRTASNAGAAYVFERDAAGTWSEVTKLIASDAEADDFFGRSVSIRGDSVLVGASWEDEGGDKAGAAYVFKRDAGGVWSEVSKLTASDAQAGDEFGDSVAMHEDFALVGAPFGNATGVSDSGAAYVFKRNAAGTWTEDAKLNASDAEAGDFFGDSVAADGDSAVIGASVGNAVGMSDTGAAYIY